ncbi:hypothetical protein M441DRAFT_191475 [Trichoderma asperellum CBS 433.97]|uniref:Intradiol ring-cleavage dioxygenases domain-containing protein n=1 Tax=Trichoderma asperellum (strain ATCC 204424 / CBS 433.97 / NBRC 101777) TaxID=1042311 RepID=A0A2T3ZCT5_TRIA4|nr:hypothetical protein M441DRAFT_191475 [Trichoderma asperellum CBS 433.97]PTB42612.1 hypothetical protein M441DRAFT_191475 [Trichoderma asperellum CBS 433.97]
MKDLTADNITENAIVRHLHDFARETRLSMAEWEYAVDFLAACGQKCSPTRQFVLLSDVIGLSLLVDSIDHPKPEGATEGTVLGPFHTHDAHHMSNGDDIGTDPDGIPMLVHCFYDVQYSNRENPHGRAVLKTDANGQVWFKAIVPVAYPVPTDGPVGDFLRAMGRHPYRPAHVHFMFDKPGYDHLITALTIRGDRFESHDPVFGVKKSLIVDINEVNSELMAKKCGIPLGMKLLEHEFVVVTNIEATKLRREKAQEIMGRGSRKVEFYNDLPFLALD